MEIPSDEDVIKAVGLGIRPTYVVKNWLAGDGFPEIKTSQVLSRLKKLQSEGRIVGLKNHYQYEWRLPL